MASWGEFRNSEPDLAQRVEDLFSGGRHKTMATVRADGRPRISGIECTIDAEELRFGSMAPARKLADLRRDARVAIHGPTISPEEGREGDWPGEAKVAGRAVPESEDGSGPAPEGAAMFRLDLEEVVVTSLNEDATRLLIDWWTPQGGRRRVERD